MARIYISEWNTKYPITHCSCNTTSRSIDGLKKQNHYQHLRSSYSPWACGRDWIQGFHIHKILSEKENEFMSMELWFRLQFVSVWAKGKFYYSNRFILWDQECILVSPSICPHTAGSQLYPCSPPLEVKAGASLHPTSFYCRTQKLHLCPTEEKQMLLKLALPFGVLKHLSYPWHKTFWHCQETKKLVLFANLRALQYSLVFNNLKASNLPSPWSSTSITNYHGVTAVPIFSFIWNFLLFLKRGEKVRGRRGRISEGLNPGFRQVNANLHTNHKMSFQNPWMDEENLKYYLES